MKDTNNVYHHDAQIEGRRLLGSHHRKHYEVGQKVAEGGMAWVYRAQEVESDSTVALKILFPQLAFDQGIRERFLEEGRIQRRLEHPHIVRVFDLIEEKNVLGLSLEWMDGGDLSEFMELRSSQPFGPDLIWGLFSPILRAMQCAHQAGIIHRDFKPANIMLKWEGELLIPKLADFGVAKVKQAAASKTSTGSVIGTLKYMSPEQLNDSKKVDARSDIYAIGVTLYHMLTGYIPFDGTMENIIYKHMFTAPTAPCELYENVSPALASVVLKCLEKKPEDRFQDCGELLDALAAVPRSDESEISSEQTVTMCFEEMARAKERAQPRGLRVKEAYSREDLDQSGTSEDDSLSGTLKLRQLSEQGRATKSSIAYSPEEATALMPMRPARPTWHFVVAGLVFVLLGMGVGLGLWLGQRPPAPAKRLATVVRAKIPTQKRALPTPAVPPMRRVSALTCEDGKTQSCYSGPAGTAGKGKCKAGVKKCQEGKWGPCLGAVLPATADTCNGIDDDCDGKVDERDNPKPCTKREGDCTRRGRWTCIRKRRVCRARAPKGVGFLKLRTTLRGRSLSVRYNGKRSSFRASTCLAIRRKTRVVVWAKGYQLCAFMARPRHKTIQLRMKKRGGMASLDDAPNYCLKGR